MKPTRNLSRGHTQNCDTGLGRAVKHPVALQSLETQTESDMFKKGDKVTRISSWDSVGAVSVTEYTVASWGKKQATLIKTDGSNAEFRVSTADASRVQGIHSTRFMLTADYTEAHALAFAAECIADEHARAVERLNWRENATKEFEQGIYARHLAVKWAAAVIYRK